jgi:hypothetical protein
MTERITDIILSEPDRTLVWMVARIIMALDPGPTREDAAEAVARAYREDVAETHVGARPETVDELMAGFGGAVMLEIGRLVDDHAEVGREPPQARIVGRQHVLGKV